LTRGRILPRELLSWELRAGRILRGIPGLGRITRLRGVSRLSLRWVSWLGRISSSRRILRRIRGRRVLRGRVGSRGVLSRCRRILGGRILSWRVLGRRILRGISGRSLTRGDGGGSGLAIGRYGSACGYPGEPQLHLTLTGLERVTRHPLHNLLPLFERRAIHECYHRHLDLSEQHVAVAGLIVVQFEINVIVVRVFRMKDKLFVPKGRCGFLDHLRLETVRGVLHANFTKGVRSATPVGAANAARFDNSNDKARFVLLFLALLFGHVS